MITIQTICLFKMPTIHYINKVFFRAQKMEMGTVIELKPGHPEYQNFIDAVKKIIDLELDISEGFQLEFNSTYTKMRKLSWT